MDLEALMGIFDGFDLAAFLPDITSLLGWVETILRICVMVGPILLLGFGLLYLVAPPKEANYGLGYRFWWSMASLDAWRFTHRLAGCVWTPLGLILTVVMAVICNGFRRMEAMDMVMSAVKCIGWELALAVVSCLVINITVIVVFDRKGYRRRDYE